MKNIPVLFLSLLIACNSTTNKNPLIIIDTQLGNIEVELYPEKAPKTVAAFLAFADKGYYNNSSFYRVVFSEGMDASMNSGLIQGGTWQNIEKKDDDVKGIKHESTQLTGLSHTSGTISLARTGIGTAGTEFFICVGDQTQFDHSNNSPDDGQGFAAFGKVIKGMNIVRKIHNQKRKGEYFEKNIIIKSIYRD